MGGLAPAVVGRSPMVVVTMFSLESSIVMGAGADPAGGSIQSQCAIFGRNPASTWSAGGWKR